jgi:hypothetical protein
LTWTKALETLDGRREINSLKAQFIQLPEAAADAVIPASVA